MIKQYISVLMALLLLCQAASAQEYCWKQTKTRAVGTIPSDCSYDQQKQGLLCYPKCNAGFTGVASVCWQDCPAGYFDDGAFCRKTGSYGRGAGFPWQAQDGVSNAGMLARCQQSTGGTCEMWGAIAYPTCKAGYYAAGANVCAQGCPNGMTDIGVSCTKQTYMRATISAQCPAGKTYEDGLCYDPCQAGFKGIGPVCGQTCPANLPYACGAGCAKNYEACVVTTSEQVMNVVSVFSDVALAVVTFGTSYGVKVAGKTAAQTAAEQGVKAAVKAVIKEMTENISKNLTKEVFINTMKTQFQSLAEDTILNLWETLSIQGSAAFAAQLEGEVPADFDYYSLDPTGIASVVKAYNHPTCTLPPPPAPAPINSIIPNALVPRLELSAGWSTIPGTSGALDASVADDGTLWVVKSDRFSVARPGASFARDLPQTNYGAPRVAALGLKQVVATQPSAGTNSTTPQPLRRNTGLFEVAGRTTTSWNGMPGVASDIAFDRIGNLYAIGQQNSIWKLPPDQTVWTMMASLPADAGQALRIAAGGVEQVSIVTDKRHYLWTGAGWTTSGAFTMPLKDVGVGENGNVFGVTTAGEILVMRGGAITKLPDIKLGAAVQTPTGITASSNGRVWVVANGGVYKFAGFK